MRQRRFEKKPADAHDAEDVWSLPADHAAIIERRTLFPTTVVEVTESEPKSLLVSGKNNRKLGQRVMKGRFKGWGLYSFTLEERATCPKTCPAFAFCYGNGMQMARRHRIGDFQVFADRMEREIAGLLDKHPGLLIRLHVLGDFMSIEYVAFWADILMDYPNVAVFGYTQRGADSSVTLNMALGEAIANLKAVQPDRFRIRWSTRSVPDGAIILDREPKDTTQGVIVCPAQTDKTACCATCALCWEDTAHTIAFLKHGRTSKAAKIARLQPEPEGGRRRISSVSLGKVHIPEFTESRPRFAWVDPETLYIEERYQRDLSVKSLRLITKIVTEFSWARFKPPICAEDGAGGYNCVDGQHSAMAAAAHPQIDMIPIMVIDAASQQSRAASFVAHNRDRVVMSSYQIFHGMVAAGDPVANEIAAVIERAGASIPKNAPQRALWKPGQISAVRRLEAIHKTHGAKLLERLLRIAVRAQCSPISTRILEAVRALLCDPEYKGMVEDRDITTALMMRPDFDRAADIVGAHKNVSGMKGAVIMLYQDALSTRRRGNAA